jgi:hypothetical protein
MKGRIISLKVEKTVRESLESIYGDLKDSTPPLTFENYIVIKKASTANDVDHMHILKVMGHRDYEIETKIEEYESRICMHKHDSK